MRVQRVEARSEELLDPASGAWGRVAAEEVALIPTPVAMQPTEYVRVRLQDKTWGLLPKVSVQGAHNGDRVFFRLVWDDPSEDSAIVDTNQFVDAAAILFPIAPDAPAAGMGLPGKPVNAWLWRPDFPAPKNVTAEGISSTQRRDDPSLSAGSRRDNGSWQVVVSRTLALKDAPSGSATLPPGGASKIAFAVWQGANQERAGVKAYSADWLELQIDA